MNNETISDIVAEMRRFAYRHRMHGEGQATKEFADRVEAAHKREIERGVEAAQICGEIGEMVGREKAVSEMKTTTAEIVDIEGRCIMEVREIGKEPTGNAAKMRKALEEISSAYGKWLYGKDDRHSDDILQKCRNIADDALSAPPRKCDLYSNSKDAHEGYKRYEQDFFLRSNSIFDNPLSLATWLFAAAEGETK